MSASPTSEPGDEVVLTPGRANGVADAPPSKSHALRAMICAALARGESTLVDFPRADDAQRGLQALRALGIGVRTGAGDEVAITGCGGDLPERAAQIALGGSATALRFFTAVCALGGGAYRLDGDATLRARPLGAIGRALVDLGAEVTGEAAPVTVAGSIARGGRVTLVAPRSSHPISALLLVGPACELGMSVQVDGDVVSRPYVGLTMATMRTFGVSAEVEPQRFTTPTRHDAPYCAARVRIEGDWSSAAPLLALGPATGGAVTVTGLDTTTAQADRAIVGVLRAFGADVEVAGESVTATGSISRPTDLDLGSCPDLAPLVGALACLAPGTTTVHGAPHLRLKESDRVASVAAAARALGCAALERDDGFEITGGSATPGTVDPVGDHRVAIAFAVAGLAAGGVRILDPGCVAKSFPGYWARVAALVAPGS